MSAASVPQRHPLDLLPERAPVVRGELGVLDALLAPVLVRARDVEERVLEVKQLVADALADEDAPCVLRHDGLLILFLGEETI